MSTQILVTIFTGLASVAFSRTMLARDERHAHLVATLAMIRLAAWSPIARTKCGYLMAASSCDPDSELAAISIHNGRI